MRRCTRILLSWACLLALTTSLQAQDQKKEKSASEQQKKPAAAKPAEKPAADSKVKTRDLVINLYNPCGVAVQPDTGHVYISGSGYQRILRFTPPKENQMPTIAEVINGFPKDVYGKGPKYEIGPLGLVFVSKNLLAVGGGGNPDGKEVLWFFDVSQIKDQPIDTKAAKHVAGPIPKSEKTNRGEGNFYALAYDGKAIYITTNGDDTKGWIARCPINNGTPGKLELFIATKPQVETTDAPVGITLSPDGKLVVGQAGEINVPEDSLLCFYNIQTGKLELKLETPLYDIVALAYHPKSKTLYALDFAWMAPDKGGLFRLDVTTGQQPSLKVTKVLSLDKPTAMAFAPDGTLYITLIGTAKEGDKYKPGKLIEVTGLE